MTVLGFEIALGSMTSKLVSGVFIKAFLTVYCYLVNISIGEQSLWLPILSSCLCHFITYVVFLLKMFNLNLNMRKETNPGTI